MADAGLSATAKVSSSWREDPYPLARLIAESALARNESRGAHQRRDFPDRDTELDSRHVTVTKDGAPELAYWR